MAKSFSFFGAALLALLSAVPASGATLLVNGSFESGPLGNPAGSVNGATFDTLTTGSRSWDAYGSLDGWTLASGPGIAVETDRSNNKIDAQDGEHYVGLDVIGNARITQTVALTVGAYTLNLWYSPNTNNAATNGIDFGITGLGSGVATVGTMGARRGEWSQISLNVLVQVAGDYQVYVGATGRSDGRGGYIDNIALTPVPLPAAGLGLLGALGLMAGLRRKRLA
ncbi:MAG: hypothetical protein R3D61_01300 [Defluviimonas denitrificans]